MPEFAYETRDQQGQMASGLLKAANVADAARLLRGDGKFVIQVGPKRLDDVSGDDPLTLEQHARRVSHDEVILFSHQMAIMVQTGVPLSEALDSVAQQAVNPHVRAVLSDVAQTVQGGATLSRALSNYPRVFPQLMISLIQASEASGTMGDMLERVSQCLTKERQTVKKIRGAMIYPLFMFVMAMGVTIFLLLFVLPRFSKIYEGRGAALPMPTQILLTTSHLALTYWYVWTGAIVAMALAFIYMRRVPGGRRTLDRVKLRLPVTGQLFNQLYITRAMQTMGAMIAAGVPMLEMIAITRGVTDNVFYQDLWDQVDEKLRHGSQLSDALGSSALVPPPIIRMIHSGEKAGRLSMVMRRIAEYTENDFDESVRRSTQFIEPVMITVMGFIIGGVAISLLLPIFSIGRVMAGG